MSTTIYLHAQARIVGTMPDGRPIHANVNGKRAFIVRLSETREQSLRGHYRFETTTYAYDAQHAIERVYQSAVDPELRDFRSRDLGNHEAETY